MFFKNEIFLLLFFQESRRSALDMAGRNDGNTKVIIPNKEIPSIDGQSSKLLQRGDYIAVQVMCLSLFCVYEFLWFYVIILPMNFGDLKFDFLWNVYSQKR